ncbi:hypothetical protein SAMN02745243_02321 [Hespellia stercorisuis DSM 15480]|uniref:Uncharacterized protein n=2 Tax=Hespellia stercorisuis TaxID=180311 RepID=A0A1M6Q5X1_9FIRM|nr:hypothetical protein SAMN02745243_02321 [Hespellia stercorisuis DSM 15480]
MKKKIKIVIGIVIALAVCFLYAHIEKNNVIYDRTVDDSEYKQTGVIESGNLNQSFVCKEDLLKGVNVKCVIVGDVSNVKIAYKLVNTGTGEEYTGTVDAKKLKNNKYYEFGMEQISGCENQEFEFILEEKGATAENGISFYITPQSEKNTVLNVKGNPTEGTVIMKTVSYRFDVETFVVLFACVAFIAGFMRMLYGLFNK